MLAANGPQLLPICVAFGLSKRIHGQNGESAPTSPIDNEMYSPAFAVNVHVSISPAAEIVALWFSPLLIGPCANAVVADIASHEAATATNARANLCRRALRNGDRFIET